HTIESSQEIGISCREIVSQHFHAIECRSGSDANHADAVVQCGDDARNMCSMTAVILTGGSGGDRIKCVGGRVRRWVEVRMGEINATVNNGDPDPGAVRTRGGRTDSLYSQRDHLTSVEGNGRRWGTSLSTLCLVVND